MAIPIINDWRKYYISRHEGLGSSYERIILNRKLHFITRHYCIKTLIETPSFGFTGLSGINSMDLARNGCQVTIEDHDQERMELIRAIWREVTLPVKVNYNPDYSHLAYPDHAFEMAWNFSALWFVSSLTAFLDELCRITRKVILLCIPNQTGMGFRLQMKDADAASLKDIHLEHISEDLICRSMQDRGWKLVDRDYIDCPPWPDIGTSKEEFVARNSLLKTLLTPFGLVKEPDSKADYITQPAKPISCLDYYSGSDPSFPQRMLRHAWFERLAPSLIKRYWAHHRYLLFLPRGATIR